MRRILIIFITILIFLASAFYDSAGGGFFDVQKQHWFYEDVKSIHKLGVVNGYPDGTFRPTDNITIAEAIAIARKVFNISYNNDKTTESFESINEVLWYTPEINFAIENGIITQNEFPNYEKIATRSEIAYIFAKVLPENQYPIINNVDKLPDVDGSHQYGAYIFKLYKAGILCGDDIYGNFQPDKAITRAEVAAIVNREIFTKKRKAFTLGKYQTSKNQNILDVQNIPQNDELPNGCAITSLTMVLNYLGYDVDKCFLADNYLLKQDRYSKGGIPYGPNPYIAYPGNPRDHSGWYCWTPPITQAANNYLKQINSTHKAINLTGITQAGLEEQIRQGHPIIVWVTRDLGDLYQSKSTYWYTEEGEKIIPYTTIHSVVLVGYDESTFKLSDPLQKISSTDKAKFMSVFQAVGSRAVIVQ